MLKWFKNKQTAPAPTEVPENRERALRLRNEGNAMLDAGRPDAAAGLYREAIALLPDDVAAMTSLGFVLQEMGNADEAQAVLSRAAKIDPWLFDAHYMLGNLARARGELEAAADHYRRALTAKPDFPDCRRDLCIVLAQAGRTKDARIVLDEGVAFAPGSADHHFFSGTLHLVDNEFADAVADFREATRLDPANVSAMTNLGLAQFKQGDVFSAVDSYLQVIAVQPDNVVAHCNLGGAYQIQGRLDLAARSYADALERDPDHLAAYNNRLYALSFDPSCSPEQYLEQAREAGAWMTAHATPYTQWRCPAYDGKRPLRVGFVSGDLRNHPVGAFLEGVLARMDRSRIELVAYASRARGDQLTERIKPFFTQWNVIEATPDALLARKIHDDAIDVLVDLAGHTAYNRLSVFAWKPAPVQLAWLGFFATTGVREMDYILVDPVSVPPEGRAYLSEQPWYVPDTRLCFTAPLTGRPLPVSEPPALRNGWITFGSFQIYSKFSDASLAAWARVLAAVPDSRLRLQNWQLGFPRAQQDVLARLAAHGVPADRVQMHGGSPRDDYLAAHGEVDILLDTFPFPGGTTTAEALWMGVPTVSKTGRTLLERQGESLLGCAGLGDWVAQDDDGFVALAVAKAGDVPALAALRARLREQVLASPLFDAARFARHLEDALEAMARSRTGSQPQARVSG